MTKQKTLLTRKGYTRLVEERENLSKKMRPKIVKQIADAAAEGDRSENAEYIYGKKHLREIDKRLSYLSSLLYDVELFDENLLKGDQICFGSTVVIRDGEGEIKKWTIVGDGEADFKEGSISYKSPVAKALMGKRVSDIIEVERPKGTDEFEVIGLLFGAKVVAGVDKIKGL